MQRKVHWENVYSTKSADEVSWYQPHAERSLAMIRSTGVPRAGAIIDVGGGASTLVDDLVGEGYQDLTVLDLSAAALEIARRRLGHQAENVNWLEGDVTTAELPDRHYDIWHDRAVFHFLIDEQDRRGYVAKVMRAVKSSGHVIIATFAEDGPAKCSGLPVMRYSAERLRAELGPSFTLVQQEHESHHTPAGAIQKFVYCYCRRAP